MNREEILRNLEIAYEEFKDKPVYTGETNVALMIRDVICFINENIDDWIPVSEPPKENGDYIVSLEDSVYPWGRFFNGKWFMLSTDGIAREFSEYEVIAWQPLPTPYKESDSE